MSGSGPTKVSGSENALYPEIKFSGNTATRSRLLITSAVLAVFFFITTVIFIVVFAYYFVKYNERVTETQVNNVCNTRDCVIAAGVMAAMINASADPCEDFSEYACGRFIRESFIPEGKTSIHSTSKLGDGNSALMKGIVTDAIKQGEPVYLTNMKRFYKSCMNEAKIEEIGLSPYLTDPLASDWPTLNKNWTGEAFNLSDVNARFQEVYLQLLFSFGPSIDPKNSSIVVISLTQPALGLGQEYFSRSRNDTKILAYERYLATVAVVLGASKVQAEQDAIDVVDLEIALSNIMVPKEATRDSNTLYNPVTLKELSTLYPDLDIPRALRASFSKANISLPDNEVIINEFPTYIGNISEVASRFSNRTLQNLFGFSYALTRVGGLTKDLREAQLEFDKVLSGVASERPRWETCLRLTSGAFATGMGKQYAERAFSKEAKTYMEEMIANLKAALKQMIEESTWMGQATKDEAYKKLATMKSKIGYPDKNNTDADIEAEYKMHTMTEDNLYDNFLLLNKVVGIETLLSLRKPIDKNKFHMGVFEVNAQYDPMQNEMTFPAGILQPPFFSRTFPDSMNYGSIGVVIGHEITHGFDDEGAQFDADGNLRNWWQKSDLDKFLQRTQCIVNQTSGFFEEEIQMHLNGIATQGEMVADNGGLKESFRAYKELASKKGEQPTLPGLGLTQDQIFFLAYSQTWCSKMTREQLINDITQDEHPIGKYRIIGPLQNSEDFAKAYNCPRGSYMNPEKKCSVW